MSNPPPRSLVYGPVPSRRLGISLGVDLIPHKICTLDCLYCQVGRTTRLGTERQDFGAPPEQVVEQVAAALQRAPDTQVITLAGSGEPTLYAPLEALILGLRQVTNLPLVLLTNGTLLCNAQVRRAVNLLDQVYPSLDAADPQTFRRINRPAPGVTLDAHLAGLKAFCQGFDGRCRLELMLVGGINDGAASLSAMAALARQLKIQGVDLNTVVRPPAHDALALTRAQLLAAQEHFHGLDVQIIASFSGATRTGATTAPGQQTRQQVLQTVTRRPCTAEDLAVSLGVDLQAMTVLLEQMVRAGELQRSGAYFKNV